MVIKVIELYGYINYGLYGYLTHGLYDYGVIGYNTQLKLKDYLIVIVNIVEPITTIESLFHPSWEHAMQHDMNSISKNDIWTLEELPLGK
jgi:hypothetical protein